MALFETIFQTQYDFKINYDSDEANASIFNLFGKGAVPVDEGFTTCNEAFMILCFENNLEYWRGIVTAKLQKRQILRKKSC